jgi:hypothetical protein
MDSLKVFKISSKVTENTDPSYSGDQNICLPIRFSNFTYSSEYLFHAIYPNHKVFLQQWLESGGWKPILGEQGESKQLNSY